MAYYASTLINQIAAKLEDAANDIFTRAQILTSLNLQQEILMTFLDKGYWTPLETKKASLTCTSGVSALTAAQFGYAVLAGRQGIIRVKITSGRYCTEIKPEDLKKHQTGYGMDASTTNPLWWVEANQLNVNAGSTVTNPVVDVLFYRKPKELMDLFTLTSGASASQFVCSDSSLSSTDDAYNGAVLYSPTQLNIYGSGYYVITDYVGSSKTFSVTPNAADTWTDTDTFYLVSHDFDQLGLDGVESDIPIPALPALVELTVADLFANDGKLDRSQSAWNRAMSIVEMLNARVKPIKGQGTHSREEGR